VVEGEEFMRAHNGAAYLYDNIGAFVCYKGIPPESTFGRVKRFLLRLEGLLRLLSRDVRRQDSALLRAIHESRNAYDDTETYLLRCEDAAIFCTGSRSKRREREDADQEGEAAAQRDAPTHWPILTAEALSRIGLQVQKELMDERIISYIIEWCDTPDRRVPGIAYNDTCVLYDTNGRNVLMVTRGPERNVYLRIQHGLLDPVLQDHLDGLKKFIGQTFWANNDVYLCFQAAQALAKRGANIDRCFIGVSPGGFR
jgi:hypothetical protein